MSSISTNKIRNFIMHFNLLSRNMIGRKPLLTHMQSLEDNIKKDLNEKEDVDFIVVALDRNEQ